MRKKNKTIFSIRYDEEGKAYQSAQFFFKKERFLFRKARLTPKKKGMFITLWKRSIGDKRVVPYEGSTACWGAVFLYEAVHQKGYFFFPKQVLIDQGIFRSQKFPGKRAMRLYAPLEKVTAKQAVKTQNWQTPYFISIERLEKNKNSFEGQIITLLHHAKSSQLNMKKSNSQHLK